MPDHPPPAPDWILGDDGHWKPPPFDSGASRAPAPPVPPGPPGGPGHPGLPTPPGPVWGPPPAPSSTGRTVAIVLGVLGIAGISFLGLLIGAVTFLGTSAEPRFEPVGAPPSSDPVTAGPGDSSGGWGGHWAENPSGWSHMALVAVYDDLAADGWDSSSGEIISAADSARTCAPDGALTGVSDRFRATFTKDGEPVGAMTIELTTYDSSGLAADELGRSRSEQYRQCEVAAYEDEYGVADPPVTVLPDDPQAPGVAYQVGASGDPTDTEYDFVVVVGGHLAHIELCTCAPFPLEDQRAVVRQIAAALAVEQGLPVPG